MTTLAKKLHAKPGMTMCVLDAPSGYQLALTGLDGVDQHQHRVHQAACNIQWRLSESRAKSSHQDLPFSAPSAEDKAADHDVFSGSDKTAGRDIG